MTMTIKSLFDLFARFRKPRSLRRLVWAARTGSAGAQYQLGQAYLTGRGAPHYPTVAAKWLRLAAVQGHAEACHSLSLIYLTGARANAPSATWAAESEGRGAPANVALLYPEGFDIRPDVDKAFGLAQAAARQGLARAQANLGMLYLRGVGCTQDFPEAERWCRFAALQRDPGGALGLGILYEHGLGVAADQTEAARWYRIAADQGNDAAATALGLLLLNGQGVSQDLQKAHRLLVGPATRGNDFAKKGLAQLRVASTNYGQQPAEKRTATMNQ
jgi:TPR repeat protein